MADTSEIDPNADLINITSGVLHAVLHRQRFICPGINRECIEFQGQFITPKTFYVMADKGSLKDWKNAIRINGKKIRRYLDAGELDFYNHAELCTGRCKSKMGNKTALSSPASFTAPSVSKKSSAVIQYENDQYSSNDSLNLIKDVDSFGDVPDVKPDVEQLRLLNELHMRCYSDTPSSSPKSSSKPSPVADQTKPVQLVQLVRNNTHLEEEDEDAMFWRAIVQLGLIDEFFREVKAKLDILKGSMIKNYVPVGDAKKASRIVNELGMRSKLDMRLCAHKFEFDRQRDKLEKEMDLLKKKVSEYEQRKEILKQKSSTYDILMSKKLKLEDMSSSDMQPQKSNVLYEEGRQEVGQFVIQSGSNSMMLMVNEDQSSEASPILNVSGSENQSKNIDGIAKGSMVMINGSQKSKSESPRPDDVAQHKAKRARIEGISKELSQYAEQSAGGDAVKREASPLSESLSPASHESSAVNHSQDTSGVTQSQISSFGTLSPDSLPDITA